jgi:D-beta-D-heptose 7-phosphate kinase/D-beta-D-heptose 1-phosphate adenosyltransferase
MITTPETVASLFAAHKARHGGHCPLVSTSGGFDPLHVGHLRCIQAASMLKGQNGLFVVIVNGDGFLKRKKGYVFMPLDERMELVASMRGVDYVVPWDDGSQFVTGAIEIIKPNIFAKGGDRSTAENVPEFDTCIKLGCAVVFGIGGHVKVQSSSDLVEKMQEPKK